VWWYIPIIPALGRLKQEDIEVQASLGYIMGSCLKGEKKNTSLCFVFKRTSFSLFLFLFCFILGLQKQTKKDGSHKARFD
jgi:hypothetical protein